MGSLLSDVSRASSLSRRLNQNRPACLGETSQGHPSGLATRCLPSLPMPTEKPWAITWAG